MGKGEGDCSKVITPHKRQIFPQFPMPSLRQVGSTSGSGSRVHSELCSELCHTEKGSAQESDRPPDFGGSGPLTRKQSSSRSCRRGNVRSRFRWEFPGAEGEPGISVTDSSRPPSALHFHSKAANSAQFRRNRVFSIPGEPNTSFFRKRLKCCGLFLRCPSRLLAFVEFA